MFFVMMQICNRDKNTDESSSLNSPIKLGGEDLIGMPNRHSKDETRSCAGAA